MKYKSWKSGPPPWVIFIAPRACAAGPAGLGVDIVLWSVLVALVLKAVGWV